MTEMLMSPIKDSVLGLPFNSCFEGEKNLNINEHYDKRLASFCDSELIYMHKYFKYALN